MNDTPRIQLLTLSGGERILRLEDEESGLSLERRLIPHLPLVEQKTKLVRMFQEMVRKELAAV